VWTDVSDLIGAQIDRQASKPIDDHRFEAVGRVVSGIMHDFNNTNAATIGGLRSLRRRLPKDNEELSHLLELTLRSAESGAALANRLLSFGRQAQQTAVVHLSDVVQGMTDLLRSSLGRGVQVYLNFPPALPPAEVDPGQLEMAILNLAVNARDAMNGLGRLILAAREQQATSDPGSVSRYVVLSVTDSGPGMNDATLARALDPFFTTKSTGEGTGLGLPMVHALAVQSGGKFVIHSTVGMGTTAEIWLPAHLD
jgi:signal transduction histidine kinase